MKKALATMMLVMIPMGLMASPIRRLSTYKPSADIPSQFSLTGETKRIEWGCPIDNEIVEAESKKAALNRLVSECIEQVSQAAASKPEVRAVIQASLIAPDLTFTQISATSHRANGTIFLETMVTVNSDVK